MSTDFTFVRPLKILGVYSENMAIIKANLVGEIYTLQPNKKKKN